MADPKADLLLKRWDQMETTLSLWRPELQQLADYIAPRKSNINQRKSQGAKHTERVMDSTAIHANALLAASMQGSLTSGTVQFFGLRIRGLALAQDHAIQVWLDQCAQTMYDELRQSSNFASESHELYLDLGAFGTGAIFEDEREPRPGAPYTGLRFQALPPGMFAVNENSEGRVDTVYYRFELSADAAFRRWPGTVGPKVRQCQERDQDRYQMFPFLHAVYPRDEYAAKGRRATQKPWASCWVDMTDRVLLAESGFEEFPFMVPRWAKSSGEVYGRGPGHDALPDILTLNKAVEFKLKAWNKVIDPTIKVRDDGVIGAVRLTPGALIHVRDMEAVQPLDLGGRFDVAEMEEEKIRGSIRRIFFSDQLQLQEGPQMTAYEVQVRYELMQRILGPTLGRLEVEWLNPMVERTFAILKRRNRFPEMPPELAQMIEEGKVTLDIEYEGPLARAQRLSESVAIQRYFQIILPLSEAKPEILDNVDFDEVAKAQAVNVNLPTKILRSPQDRDDLRAARQQLQQQQAQQEQMAQLAESAGKGAPMVKALMEANAAGMLPQAPGSQP